MQKDTTALFLGRFQPFHLGHADAIRQILGDPLEQGGVKGVTTLLIAIGSSQISHEPDNPFTAGERWQMIHKAMKDMGYDDDVFHIMPLADISHNHLWPYFVEQQLPPFSHVFSGSKWVLELFGSLKNLQTTHLLQREPVTATDIRNAIISGENIDHLIPETTKQVLTEINAAERLKNITHRGFS